MTRETAKVIVKRNEDLLPRDTLGALFFRVAQRQLVRRHAVDLGRERNSRIVDAFFQILEGAGSRGSFWSRLRGNPG